MTHFHLANLFAIPGLRRHGAGLLRQAKAAGLVTTLDTGWDQQGRWMEDLGPALAWTDLLFVNREETIGLAGTGDLAQAASIFAARGAGMIVFKLGAAGCAVWQGGEMEHIPAFEVEAVDTTGAGDCFAGAFLAAWSGGAGAREGSAPGQRGGGPVGRRPGGHRGPAAAAGTGGLDADGPAAPGASILFGLTALPLEHDDAGGNQKH